MLKTYAFINLQNLQGFTINDGMFSYYHHYQINVLVIYKCNYLLQQTKSLQQRLELYSHGLPNYLIHFKQPHNNMHGHPCAIQKIDN